ncbi:carboxypeptidase M32 [Pyrobaculum aerophilum]|uniref:Metal-dependent carboxypeptidase n=2 Tax=Pyrobaculum aerophilum TaxID=13773 RepID=Q8ZY98_PYRAE|nr:MULTISPECIES: carboxypeptidase M32 [Pyrobaculum]AAL63098.1 thermostable carboxypeptidase [Pyrobaculum aerophilum str. IM2]MCX8135533.1 carboxypeptidase M32 [Pyrobaculum aerophilum]HII48137.1 carboxypeptidase M32 [Pyrobaculum aerophilum]
MIKSETVKQILEHYRVIWALSHAQALLGWDSETYMPEEGIKGRAVARAEIAQLIQRFMLEEKFVKLIEKAEEEKDLTDVERGIIRVLKRDLKFYQKVPPEIVKEFTKVTSEAFIAWRGAKEKAKFDIFAPYLERIVELSRVIADKLGYEEHPYDALLDLYEEGLTSRDVESVFSVLEPGIRKLLGKLESIGWPKSHKLEEEPYDKTKMEAAIREVLELVGYPKGRFRIDISPHPFTIGITTPFDVRITVRYRGVDFKEPLFSALHEYGHALYELNVDESLAMTPVGTGVSLGVHESQSRFMENVIGRSREFVEKIAPILRKHLDFLSKYGNDDLFYYFNVVRPSLIRTEADEVTYNLHILLRYKLERLMITGEVKVNQLPELWNSEMERLLGVRPKNDAEGVLQDVHWSHGSIGYFPTYTLGNVVAAMIYYKHGRIRSLVAEGNITAIKEYLREKIHKWGSVYPPKELLMRSFGEAYNAEYLVKYLEEKYS